MGDEELGLGAEVLEKGGALQKTTSEFTQAIVIQKPRQRQAVITACEEEAAIAGEEFYYSWTVKAKDGPKLVEGLSIGGALSAARNWGNCAIPCKVDETDTHYIFTASFIDFETGFNLQRVFKQRKEQNIGMKDTARADDITFQIGQSKAIRNVALNAMPSWLIKKMLDKAKEQVIAKITKMGVPVAQKKALEFFKKHGISIERVEKKMAKNHTHWTAEDLAIIQGAMSSLVNGQESADSLFPEVSESATVATNKKAESLKEKIASKKKAKTEVRTRGKTAPVGEEKKPSPTPRQGEIAATETKEEETKTEEPLITETKEPEGFVSEFNNFVKTNSVPADKVTQELLDLGYERPDDVQGEGDQAIVMQYFRDTFAKPNSS